MGTIFYEGKVLWSQLDPNMHLRHSAYADFAAQARLEMLEKIGFNTRLFQELRIGPILFREELIYLKEVGANDIVKVSCELTKSRKDGSRWSFIQELYKGDDIKAAVIHVDGAWIDIQKRKLATLPDYLIEKFMSIPRSADFQEE